MAENYTFLRMINGTQGHPGVISVPVAATQTITVGNLLVLSSNKVALGSASVAAPFAIAAEDSASAAAGTLIRVYPILPGQVWRATADASATSSILAGGTFDINNDAGQTVDIGDTSGGAIFILATRDSSTDVEILFTKGVFF